MCKISIIVPVYNTEDYLKRCLDSILKQTFTDFELIIVNDGSPDASQQIIDDYILRDSRIKCINQNNQGLSMARNNGLKTAVGEYVCFIDSDDWINENYLYYLLKGAEESHSDISIVNYLEVSDVSQEDSQYNFSYKVMDGKEVLYEIYKPNSTKYIVAWNKLYKKSLFNNISYPPNKLHEDEFTTYKLLAISKSVCVIDMNLYYYYFNDVGIMNSKYNIRRLDLLTALEERIFFFYKLDFNDLLNLSVKSYLIQLLKNYYYVINYLDDRNLKLVLKKKIEYTASYIISADFSIKNKILARISNLIPFLLGKYISGK